MRPGATLGILVSYLIGIPFVFHLGNQPSWSHHLYSGLGAIVPQGEPKNVSGPISQPPDEPSGCLLENFDTTSVGDESVRDESQLYTMTLSISTVSLPQPDTFPNFGHDSRSISL